MVLCLGEPPGGFCDVGCCCCFPHWRFLCFRATFPCHRHSTPSSQACKGLQWLWALPWLLSIALLLPGFFRHSFTASSTVLSGHFLPTDVFYLTLLYRHFSNSLWESDVGRNPGSSSVPALTELSLPANTWTWTTHIVVTRPLTYQLRQWATKNRVKIELLNMFHLFKVKCKNY